jgi:excisionase family DNA binding protein
LKKKNAGLTTDYPLILTVNDVARILSISKAKSYEIVHSKGFPLKHIGRSLRIPRDAFFKWIDSLENPDERNAFRASLFLLNR